VCKKGPDDPCPAGLTITECDRREVEQLPQSQFRDQFFRSLYGTGRCTLCIQSKQGAQRRPILVPERAVPRTVVYKAGARALRAVGKGYEGDGVVRVEAGCAEGGPEAVRRRGCGVDAVVAAEGLLWAWLVSVLYSCTYSRICMHLE
jgi:hypothetical protein